MSDQTMRTAIKTMLDAVPGIGRVNDYGRWTKNPTDFLDLFKDPGTGKIFGWEITRPAVRIERLGNRRKMIHSYAIEGYYALKDSAATEKTFQSIIDLILLKFTHEKIPGTQGRELPRAESIKEKFFGGVLCHTASIRLPDVAEYVEPAAEAGIEDLLKVGLDYYLQDPADDGNADSSDVVTLPGPV